MRRFKPEAEGFSILQRTIPAVHTNREEKMVGGFIEVAGKSALLGLNINVGVHGSSCTCSTNKACTTSTPTSTKTTTTTTEEPNSLSFVMEALF